MDSQLKDIKYINDSAENLVEKIMEENKFDIITSMEVIEHVNDAEEFVKTLQQLLKPNGLLFLSTINKSFLGWFYTIVLAEHVSRVVPIGTHSYNKFISPVDLSLIC